MFSSTSDIIIGEDLGRHFQDRGDSVAHSEGLALEVAASGSSPESVSYVPSGKLLDPSKTQLIKLEL